MPIAILLLVQDAPPPPAQPGGFLENVLGGMFVPLALCFLVFWLMILRPESKNRKKRQEMLANLQKGDEVVTNGGLYGTVVQVQDGIVTLQVDEGVRLRFAVQSIQSREGVPAPEPLAKSKT